MTPICTVALQLSPPPALLSLRYSSRQQSSQLLHSAASPLRFRPLTRPVPVTSAVRACASSSEIDMVLDHHGVYAPKHKKVVILWDLDNKPPRGPPYQAAMALKSLAAHFGDVSEASAYANRHAFVHLPQWVLDQRRQRRALDVLERKGLAAPADPYVCSVCGRKCKTNLDLKKHFKQLHERERQKKLNRMKSLKGKKRQRFKERFITGNHKYNEAARELITPKVGYGLAGELRRAGVFVKTVEDKPQAADWALKRQMQHSMSSGIDWLVLVSDDSDFSEMLRRAKKANLGTVVVGDWDKALGRHADVWVPWIGVEKGDISQMDLMPRRSGVGEFAEEEEEVIESWSELDGVVDQLLVADDRFNRLRISAFSEGEEEEEERFGERYSLFGDSDDEDDDDDDDIFLYN